MATLERTERLLERRPVAAGRRRAPDAPLAAVLSRRRAGTVGSRPCVPGPSPKSRPSPVAGPRVRLHDTATGELVPVGPESGTADAVRLRHHPLRRHPPRSRQHLRGLRPAGARVARRRAGGALRPERHRRRRPAARARGGDRRRLARPRRVADRAVPRRTWRRCRSSRRSGTWASWRPWTWSRQRCGTCSPRAPPTASRGRRWSRRRRVLPRRLRRRASARSAATTARRCWQLSAERGGDPAPARQAEPAGPVAVAGGTSGRAARGTAGEPRPGPARAGTSSARRSRCSTWGCRSTCRPGAATSSSPTTRWAPPTRTCCVRGRGRSRAPTPTRGWWPWTARR